jgi:S-(hydroxymethyl)glutathione dehydrogenase/alcohol dehydrogenase
MVMKAAVLTVLNAPLTVADIAMPDSLAYGQVAVKILASGICGAQLQEIRGEKGNAPFLPHLLGHEGCGIVETVGEGVTRVKPGDKVVLHWRKAAGIEAACPTYGWWKKPDTGAPGREMSRHSVGGGRVTTLSEYTVASENRLTPVPKDTPVELCALLGCGLSTALGTIESEAAVKFGESVLIVGTGGLGCNLIRCACMAKANPVVAVDIHANKRRMALDLGATHYVDSTKDDLSKIGRFDVVIDTAGAGDSMEKTLPLLGPSGRFIMVGQPGPGKAVSMTNARHMFEGEGKTIKATQGGGFRPELDIPRYVRMWKAGVLNIDGIITARLPLRQINKGIELVKAGKASRVLIDMTI